MELLYTVFLRFDINVKTDLKPAAAVHHEDKVNSGPKTMKVKLFSSNFNEILECIYQETLVL